MGRGAEIRATVRALDTPREICLAALDTFHPAWGTRSFS